MDENSGLLVFAILIPLFVAVGLYLLWYKRRRTKMLAFFARQHNLPMRPEYKISLQTILDQSFSLETKGVVRSFGELAPPIKGEGIWLFRTVELLDLNPSCQSYSTHFSRIAALFEVPAGYDHFFLLDKSMQARQLLANADPIDPALLESAKLAYVACHAHHPLSITLAGGYALLYFEPLVTGGENLTDIESLYCLARGLQQELMS